MKEKKIIEKILGIVKEDHTDQDVICILTTMLSSMTKEAIESIHAIISMNLQLAKLTKDKEYKLLYGRSTNPSVDYQMLVQQGDKFKMLGFKGADVFTSEEGEMDLEVINDAVETLEKTDPKDIELELSLKPFGYIVPSGEEAANEMANLIRETYLTFETLQATIEKGEASSDLAMAAIDNVFLSAMNVDTEMVMKSLELGLTISTIMQELHKKLKLDTMSYYINSIYAIKDKREYFIKPIDGKLVPIFITGEEQEDSDFREELEGVLFKITDMFKVTPDIENKE